VDGVARERRQAGGDELGAPDDVLDRATADRHVGRVARFVRGAARPRDGEPVGGAVVPQALLLGERARSACDRPVLAALGGEALQPREQNRVGIEVATEMRIALPVIPSGGRRGERLAERRSQDRSL